MEEDLNNIKTGIYPQLAKRTKPKLKIIQNEDKLP
jgi:hypothetical protein